ncbi:hypothetical protein R9C00_11230 [Flammeovirgaceae bacterium SG7u.111]|nr:hypothetical protein [Flammeovirgaceae bacterium SG7u.132]WPO38024.1 hypothetical protein R9C00_11230 [Flammeovirgaceae bacterium SG7u.111]
MKQLIFVLILITFYSCANGDYKITLSNRLQEIKAFSEYDNTPVVYPDSFRIKIYSYNNKDFNPYHPYQFLRDSAKIDDLVNLVQDENPFVRTYAFGALQQRGYVDLFSILIDKLSDTTKISTFTDDYGYASTPPDMMLTYIAQDLNSIQKDSVSDLIIRKYKHLKTLDDILLFHKPKPEHYSFIREIAQDGLKGKFALVALARYQRLEDIPIIDAGWNYTDYFSGYKVFFMAIEEFNHPEFIHGLLKYKASINKGWDNQGHDYYFNALAKYKDEECTKVIQEFIDVKEYKSEAYKLNNLRMIRRALKKYYSEEYDKMLKDIETKFTIQEELDYDDNHLYLNPWNY